MTVSIVSAQRFLMAISGSKFIGKQVVHLVRQSWSSPSSQIQSLESVRSLQLRGFHEKTVTLKLEPKQWFQEILHHNNTKAEESYPKIHAFFSIEDAQRSIYKLKKLEESLRGSSDTPFIALLKAKFTEEEIEELAMSFFRFAKRLLVCEREPEAATILDAAFRLNSQLYSWKDKANKFALVYMQLGSFAKAGELLRNIPGQVGRANLAACSLLRVLNAGGSPGEFYAGLEKAKNDYLEILSKDELNKTWVKYINAIDSLLYETKFDKIQSHILIGNDDIVDLFKTLLSSVSVHAVLWNDRPVCDPINKEVFECLKFIQKVYK